MARSRCKTPRCRNVRRKEGADCCKCHMRAWRARWPYRAAFATLRDHARGRGIEFELTFEQFHEFAVQSEYVERKGSTRDCLTVDRVRNTVGYVAGNLQPLTRSKNSEKRCRQDQMRAECGYRWRKAA